MSTNKIDLVVNKKYYFVSTSETNRMISYANKKYFYANYKELTYKGYFEKEYKYDSKHVFKSSKGDWHFSLSEIYKGFNVFQTKDEAIIHIAQEINKALSKDCVISANCRIPLSTYEGILRYAYKKYPEEML